MSNSINNKSNTDITATTNTNKEETTMSNNATSNNEATVNVENKEESIMNNNATSNNEVTVNVENKEVTAMNKNRTNNNNMEVTDMRNSETENKNMETDTMSEQTNNRAEETAGASSQPKKEKPPINYNELEYEFIRRAQGLSRKKNRRKKTTISKKGNKSSNKGETDAINNLGEMSPTDISSLIPAEEQAVAEGKVIFHEMPDMHKDLISEIPEDELEDVSESEVTDLTLAREQGCFLAVQGMKGFMSDFGDRFFARVHVDEKHNKFIEFCQQYKNEETSAKLKIPYADLVLAEYYKFNSKAITETRLRNRLAKFLSDTTLNYYNKLDYPEERLDIINLLNTLVNNYSKLPITSDVPKYDIPEVLYSDTIRNIKNLGEALVNEHDAYYTLDKDQMNMVAEGMGMKRDELLKKLKEFSMLYLTSSSNGYQTCVRFKNNPEYAKEFLGTSHTQWCYCVLKMEYLAMRRKMKSEE